MIKENQKLFNNLNILSDAAILFASLPIAFWLRFFVLPGGIVSVPLRQYFVWDVVLVCTHLFAYAALGVYRSFRQKKIIDELKRIWLAGVLNVVLLLSVLFLQKDFHFSRATFAIYFFISVIVLSVKRIVLRKTLRYFRNHGYNRKRVLVIGNGRMAKKYIDAIARDRELGYHAIGYVASVRGANLAGLRYLGAFEKLGAILDEHKPDEVICAIELDDYAHMTEIIAATEKSGTKLSMIPFYAEFMPSNPQFDEVGGVPLLNIRRIPLDNWANAFIKRAVDIIGSLLLIIVSSPVMLVCALGVKISSPGPVIFKQARVGRNKKIFYMYKFRSMRVNAQSDTAWSTDSDSRKTRFGSFIRKCSLDEFPQFFNVLKGDMSLVGPRPELPHYVEQFKEEIPLYMVKHQVRPGITGWAQVNDFRGDTSIKARVEHDIYYIEHWDLIFDIKILLMTVFKAKFLNSEKLS
ncbi:MAG: undecaprenyl-phosphate glucose phosphotransferase [Ruminococcaceae bacterium]|nr:undecaprenyl-phosphate glucose phosphotransferase [Oscillospiraceae bacterium]